MDLKFLTVDNNINIGFSGDSEIKGDLKYFFMIRPSKGSERICFSVFLMNHGNSIINRIWFSSFVGIGGITFAPGLDNQDAFSIKQFNLKGSYLSGYTKDFFKLSPGIPLEILYFDIPREKLLRDGSLEFCFGCECVKKISFIASWNKEEIENKHIENTEKFLLFLKHKNRKIFWKDFILVKNYILKYLKRFFMNIINYFGGDINL